METLVALVVSGMVLYALVGFLSVGNRLGKKELDTMELQADAQRSLARLLRELDEAMELLQPQPGGTLPFAVVRDKVNRLVLYSPAPPAKDGTSTLVAYTASADGVKSEPILAGVRRITFTSQSDGAVRFHVILGNSAPEGYAFLTQVRFRNRPAADL